MSPMERGTLFHPEQGTGLTEAPTEFEEDRGDDQGLLPLAAGVYRPGEDWRPDPLPQFPPPSTLLG